jgi:HEAT repeat protein
MKRVSKEQLKMAILDLGSFDDKLRNEAETLLFAQGEEARPLLIEALVEKPKNSGNIALCLAALHDKQAVLPLITAVIDPDCEPKSRSQILLALSELIDSTHAFDEQVIANLEILVKDEQPMVRGFAARIVGQLEDKRLFEVIRKLTEDSDSFVRKEAVKAQKRMLKR